MTVNLIHPLKVLLGFLATGILIYNFYIANNLKYETGGDALSFITLGVSLGEFQKYGQLEVSDGSLMEAFKNQKISREEIRFAGHSIWRPPVWPFLIAITFILFGYNLTYILVSKFLLHLLGTFIFYKTLKLLDLKKKIIIIGSFLYSISPAWQLYSRVFLSEPVTFFFLTLWVYLLIKFIQKRSSLLPQAVVGGILILSHPYSVFLPFSVWLILFINRQLNIKTFIISYLICAAIVSVWVVRNFIVLETNEIVLTTSSGAVMAKGWNPNIPEEHTNTKGDLADEKLVLQKYQYNINKNYGEVEQMQLYKNASIHFIRNNPDLIIPIILRKLKSAFNPFPETPKPGALEEGRWFFQFLALLSITYILLFTSNKLFKSLVIGLLMATVGITILTYSGFRFRMPQVALELLFIVFVINDILRRNKIKVHNRNGITITIKV